MNISRQTPRLLSMVAFGAFVLAVPASAEGSQEAPISESERRALNAKALRLEDGAASSSDLRLLDLARRSASALPLEPHVKNRARAQESVVLAYLEEGLPESALACAEEVPNWRRGLAYAHLAYYCAEHGDERGAKHFAAVAKVIADNPREKNVQEWRSDRIRVRIAQAYALLGDEQLASAMTADVVPSESAKVQATEAARGDEEDYEAAMAYVESVTESSDFEYVQNAVGICIELFGANYADEERRKATEGMARQLWAELPRSIVVELLLGFSKRTVEAGDAARGLDFATEASELVDGVKWTLEKEVELKASIARAFHGAGDTKRGLELADAALVRYQESSEDIVDMFRAGALRPLAEAFRILGEEERAALVYRMAIEEGALNPNSRPRAEDLTATCLSMAAVDFEPDDEMWKRLGEIFKFMGHPW